MAHVTIAEVQGWLDPDRLAIPANDALIDDVQFSVPVLAKVAQVMDTSTWVDVSTTPPLIRKIISALIAANRYNRIYSEEEDAGNKYADKLEKMAWGWAQAIVDGKMVVFDNSGTEVLNNNDPAFHPRDVTGAQIIYDALGNARGWEGSEEIKFFMADTF